MYDDTKISVVYNAGIDEFIKIKSLSTSELTGTITKLASLIKKPGFKIGDYMLFLIRECVVGYKSYDYIEEGDSIFACVTEVYPIFQVSMACQTLNELNFEIEEGSEKPPMMALSAIEKVGNNIKKDLIGQDSAVDECIGAIKLMAAGLTNHLSLFFIGPTGVGKTELAKLLADKYLGTREKLIKINCSEYGNGHEYAKLIGSPPGYIGHTEKGILTDKAEESSEWVLLFDEIEKGHPKFLNLLLGLLDDGTIVDNQGMELDFSKSIILFTSNIGIKDNVGRVGLGFGKEVKTQEASQVDIEKSLKEEFSPEFINRMSSVVYFNSLSLEDAVKIASLNLKKLPIRVTKTLSEYVAKNGFSVEYGARNITRFIQKNVSIKIADRILENGCVGKYKITLKKDGILEVNDI